MWPLSELVCIPQKGTCPHAERCRAMAWLHGSGGGGAQVARPHPQQHHCQLWLMEQELAVDYATGHVLGRGSPPFACPRL